MMVSALSSRGHPAVPVPTLHLLLCRRALIEFGQRPLTSKCTGFAVALMSGS
jgi:hypothetical protein